MISQFNCQRCGNCCKTKSGGLSISDDDLKRWRKSKRIDILEQVELLVFDNEKGIPISIKGKNWDENKHAVLCAVLWFLPDGKMLKCPFLKNIDKKKYECLIYDILPDDCKKFPFDDNGIPNKNLSDVCPEVRRISRE